MCNVLTVAFALFTLLSSVEAASPDLNANSSRSMESLEAPALESTAASAQGPLGGPQIAVIESLQGDVRVGRAVLRTNVTRVNATGPGLANGFTRVSAPGLRLASGDIVQTLQGKADIRFSDQSIITLDVGTTVTISERPAAGGIQRTIQQFIGYIWFNFQHVNGTATTLQTPTAVAAIRGTEGTEEVPNDNQSTHSLNEGVEQLTELVTRQSGTIRSGQRITAIRGVGFAPIIGLAALIPKPGVAAGGGGGVAGGGAAGAAGGAATGAATATAATAAAGGAAAASSTAAVSVVAASVTAGALVTAAVIPVVTHTKEKPSTGHAPLNPPGGSGLLDKGTNLPQLIVRMIRRPRSSAKREINKRVEAQKIKLKIFFPRGMPSLNGTVPVWR
jgi:hypothetical protein